MVAYAISWIIGTIPVYSVMAKNAEAGDIHLAISANAPAGFHGDSDCGWTYQRHAARDQSVASRSY